MLSKSTIPDIAFHSPRIRSFMVSAYAYPTFQLSDAVPLLAARERKLGCPEIPYCPEIPPELY